MFIIGSCGVYWLYTFAKSVLRKIESPCLPRHAVTAMVLSAYRVDAAGQGGDTSVCMNCDGSDEDSTVGIPTFAIVLIIVGFLVVVAAVFVLGNPKNHSFWWRILKSCRTKIASRRSSAVTPVHDDASLLDSDRHAGAELDIESSIKNLDLALAFSDEPVVDGSSPSNLECKESNHGEKTSEHLSVHDAHGVVANAIEVDAGYDGKVEASQEGFCEVPIDAREPNGDSNDEHSLEHAEQAPVLATIDGVHAPGSVDDAGGLHAPGSKQDADGVHSPGAMVDVDAVHGSAGTEGAAMVADVLLPSLAPVPTEQGPAGDVECAAMLSSEDQNLEARSEFVKEDAVRLETQNRRPRSLPALHAPPRVRRSALEDHVAGSKQQSLKDSTGCGTSVEGQPLVDGNTVMLWKGSVRPGMEIRR